MATEKIYTAFEIKRINSLGTAVPNQSYTDELGNVYFGTTSKHLLLTQPASASRIGAIPGIESGTVEGALTELSDRVTTIEDDYVTEAELALKSDKCFTMAMAIAL